MEYKTKIENLIKSGKIDWDSEMNTLLDNNDRENALWLNRRQRKYLSEIYAKRAESESKKVDWLLTDEAKKTYYDIADRNRLQHYEMFKKGALDLNELSKEMNNDI